MTQLSDAEIAQTCRAAGFGRPALHTAVACVIASSNGHPGYEHAIYPGPVALYKGLWGVDLCEHGDLLGVDLADPWRAAEAAYDLTLEHDGFNWCPAYRSGAYVHHLVRATVASSMLSGPSTQRLPVVAYTARQVVEAAQARLSGTHNAIGDHATRRGI